MFIDGIGFTGYRSFGDEIQRIGPFSKINLFVGKNNSGKSNILKFIADQVKNVCECIGTDIRATPFQFDDLDRHENRFDGSVGYPSFEFGLGLSGANYRKTVESPQLKARERSVNLGMIDRILATDALSHKTGLSWFGYAVSDGRKLTLRADLIEELASGSAIRTDEWRNLCEDLTGQRTGDVRNNWIPEVLRRLSPVLRDLPRTTAVPAFREISSATSNPTDFSFQDLIPRLNRLARPTMDALDDQNRFRAIQQFLRTVTRNTDATLEIRHDNGTIHMSTGDKTMPLENLGTGIHQVVMLAAATTLLEKQIVCIEEPKLHLHPALQKHLIRYLADTTTNQYFISSHSTHIMDDDNVAIFHVTNDGSSSIVTPVQTASGRFQICVDLGYRASDLVQTNCIIWVEGPSDRMYVNHWIGAIDNDLLEGIHYSIMFYGGRLLSNLTANDPEVDEFISLRRLNRNVAIVMDSDLKSSDGKVNETKLRIQKEIEESDGLAWVTTGREIENYVDLHTLADAVGTVRSTVELMDRTDRYDAVFRTSQSSSVNDKSVDKIKVAREVAVHTAGFAELDLDNKIHKLVEFIRTAREK